MIVDMKVELLYFDGCPNWVEMDARVRAALESVSCGDGEVERVLVSTPAQAEEMGFPGSPTVLVDGRDPFAEPGAPVGLACRLYRSGDELAGLPTVQQLAGALTRLTPHGSSPGHTGEQPLRLQGVVTGEPAVEGVPRPQECGPGVRDVLEVSGGEVRS